jgi:hypothetical protein
MCLLEIDFTIVVMLTKVIAVLIVRIVVLELNGHAHGCPSHILRYFNLIHVTESSLLDMNLNIMCALLFRW